MAMTIYGVPSDLKVPDMIEFMRSGDKDWIMNYESAEATFIESAQSWAKTNVVGKSDLVGELLSLPYADGRAYYVVVKIGRNHGLMHLPLGDAWRDPNFEDTANLVGIRAILQRQEAFKDALFAAKVVK